MSEAEAIETIISLVDYIEVVSEVVETYLNGGTGIDSLEELDKSMKDILNSFKGLE